MGPFRAARWGRRNREKCVLLLGYHSMKSNPARPAPASNTTLANKHAQLSLGLLPSEIVPKEPDTQKHAESLAAERSSTTPETPLPSEAGKDHGPGKKANQKQELHVHIPAKQKEALKELSIQTGMPMGILLADVIRVGLPAVRSRIQRQEEL